MGRSVARLSFCWARFDAAGVATIDVEYVPERKVKREEVEKPDLIVDEDIDVTVDCQTFGETPNCAFGASFKVSNICMRHRGGPRDFAL